MDSFNSAPVVAWYSNRAKTHGCRLLSIKIIKPGRVILEVVGTRKRITALEDCLYDGMLDGTIYYIRRRSWGYYIKRKLLGGIKNGQA